MSDRPDFDLDDARLRRSASVKWTWAGPDVLPAWVAEMDVAVCPPIAAALHRAVDEGNLCYPAVDAVNGLPEATAGFLRRRFGWGVDPARILSTGDVMAGIMLALTTLCEPGPVAVPVPTYPPFLAAVPLTGHELVTVPMLEPGVAGQDGGGPAGGWRLDLAALDAVLTAGARTVLLANPHNPTGRVFTRSELEALRDLVLRHGARVISDDIHAPLVLPGAQHVPYASLEGTAEHVTTLVAATKAWNLPGLKCAQIVTGTAADTAVLKALPPVANHGLSPLGTVASVVAYTDGLDWLDALLTELAGRRALFGELLAEHLPALTWQPNEGTYLTWLDAGATGLRDPAAHALAHGGVMVNRGATFGPGDGRYDRFVRVNIGTSAERLERVVKSLTAAWAG